MTETVEIGYDVIVVGLGPVGAFTTRLLAGYGVRVLALERDTTPFAAPRAVTMDDETLRNFGLAGLARWMDGHVYKAPLELRTEPPPAARSPHSGCSVVGPMPPRFIEETG